MNATRWVAVADEETIARALSRARRRRRGRARAVAARAAEIVANAAGCLGALFLVNQLAGLGLGTPEGVAGALSGAALLALSVLAAWLPSHLRRRHRIHPQPRAYRRVAVQRAPRRAVA